MARALMQILWPAFMAAALLELLVFAHVDPSDVRTLAGERLELSRQRGGQRHQLVAAPRRPRLTRIKTPPGCNPHSDSHGCHRFRFHARPAAPARHQRPALHLIPHR
jgi:hypothetical protein